MTGSTALGVLHAYAQAVFIVALALYVWRRSLTGEPPVQRLGDSFQASLKSVALSTGIPRSALLFEPIPRASDLVFIASGMTLEPLLTDPLSTSAAEGCLRCGASGNCGPSLSPVAFDPREVNGLTLDVCRLFFSTPGLQARTDDPLGCLDRLDGATRLSLACALAPDIFIDRCFTSDELAQYASPSCQTKPLLRPLSADCCRRITHYSEAFLAHVGGSPAKRWAWNANAINGRRLLLEGEDTYDWFFSMTRDGALQAEGYAGLLAKSSSTNTDALDSVTVVYSEDLVPVRFSMGGSTTSNSTHCLASQARLNFPGGTNWPLPSTLSLECSGDEAVPSSQWTLDRDPNDADGPLVARQYALSTPSTVSPTIPLQLKVGPFARLMTNEGRVLCMSQEAFLYIGLTLKETDTEAAFGCKTGGDAAIYLSRSKTAQDSDGGCVNNQMCSGWFLYAKPRHRPAISLRLSIMLAQTLRVVARGAMEKDEHHQHELRFQCQVVDQANNKCDFTKSFALDLPPTQEEASENLREVPVRDGNTQNVAKSPNAYTLYSLNERDARVIHNESLYPIFSDLGLSQTEFARNASAPPGQTPCNMDERQRNITELYFTQESCAYWSLEVLELRPRNMTFCADGFFYLYLEGLGDFAGNNYCVAIGPNKVRWPDPKPRLQYVCSSADDMISQRRPELRGSSEVCGLDDETGAFRRLEAILTAPGCTVTPHVLDPPFSATVQGVTFDNSATQDARELQATLASCYTYVYVGASATTCTAAHPKPQKGANGDYEVTPELACWFNGGLPSGNAGFEVALGRLPPRANGRPWVTFVEHLASTGCSFPENHQASGSLHVKHAVRPFEVFTGLGDDANFTGGTLQSVDATTASCQRYFSPDPFANMRVLPALVTSGMPAMLALDGSKRAEGYPVHGVMAMWDATLLGDLATWLKTLQPNGPLHSFETRETTLARVKGQTWFLGGSVKPFKVDISSAAGGGTWPLSLYVLWITFVDQYYDTEWKKTPYVNMYLSLHSEPSAPALNTPKKTCDNTCYATDAGNVCTYSCKNEVVTDNPSMDLCQDETQVTFGGMSETYRKEQQKLCDKIYQTPKTPFLVDKGIVPPYPDLRLADVASSYNFLLHVR